MFKKGKENPRLCTRQEVSRAHNWKAEKDMNAGGVQGFFFYSVEDPNPRNGATQSLQEFSYHSEPKDVETLP